MTPEEIVEYRNLGCSNHGCIFHRHRTGLGTNAGCRCVHDMTRDGSQLKSMHLEQYIRALQTQVDGK